MSHSVKYAIPVVVFTAILSAAGYLFISSTGFELDFSDFAGLAVLFASVTAISLIVFARGQQLGPESQTFHTLVAISLKFILDLVVALVWLIVLKKTEVILVVVFFLLYLAFSLFLVFIILKTLKNRSLHNKY